MHSMVTLLTFALVLGLWTGTPRAAAPFCAAKLGAFTTHATNVPRFGTPIASGTDGAITIAYITPGLATVLRRYDPGLGQWSPETVLTPTTSPDAFHTQPSLGIDLEGVVHAVGNMHATPWQYWRGTAPHRIDTMQFLGQEGGTKPGLGIPQDSGCTGQCATDWMRNEPGIAAIPGNQITYPHFGTTSDGTLFLAFRECLLCDASYHDRQWSAGLVRYHVASKTWARVAGIRPWATAPGKLPIGLRLAGDAHGRLHAAWVWCNAYNAPEGSNACFAHQNFVTYARSDDLGLSWTTASGTPLTLPLAPGAADVVSGPAWFDAAGAPGYYSGHVSLTADPQQGPMVVVFPQTNTDEAIHRGVVWRQDGHWTQPPLILGYRPSLVYRDGRGRWIGVSSGLRIHVSTDQGATWTLWPLDLEHGTFDFAWDRAWLQRTGQLRLYINNGTTGYLAVWSLTFPDSGRCGE